MTITIDNVSPRVIALYFYNLLKITRRKSYENADRYLPWKELYDTVFSDEISKKIFSRFPDFKYDDPDTDYEEDVCAFIDAFLSYARFDLGSGDSEKLPSFENWLNSFF